MKNMFLLFVLFFIGLVKGSEVDDQQMGSSPIACQLKKIIISASSHKNTHSEVNTTIMTSNNYYLRLNQIVPTHNKLISIQSVTYKNDNLIIKVLI